MFIFIKPVKTFWITKTKILRLLLFVLLFLSLSQTTKSLIFRNTENVSFSDYDNFSDLEDSNLAAFTSGRSILYLEAIDLIKAKLYFGNGFLSWTDINNSYNTSITTNGKEKWSLHSTILQYWAETGLFGLSLYILYLLSIATIGKKLIRSNDLLLSLSGIIFFYVPIFMILGGTLDNHNIGYSLLHFTAGLGIVLIYNKNNIMHLSY
jgi:O-antigen ligase